ncbi:MAG TPA: flagellar biosynthesis protein FlhB [Alphaproteobacteria bacterium]
MAEEDDSKKTEEPTQKRLDDARKQGQVAISRELNHWFMLFGVAVAVGIFLPDLMRSVTRLLTVFLEAPHAIDTDVAGLQAWVARLAGDLAVALLPVFVILIVAGLGAALIQTGPILTVEPIKPKLEKISPMRGLKRIFSLQSAVELAKGLAKIAVVGVTAWMLLRPEFDGLDRFAMLDATGLLAELHRLALKLLVAVLAVMAMVAGLDFLYQKIAYRRRMRMSREEIRDEFKQLEGDPTVKGRLRQIRMERARRRMMQEVPKADVVITNPTHFAVALRYEQATMSAPKVVAKGVDLVARRIREIAEEHRIPIVENPPLARALYKSVELDQEIPPEHYKAVAEVISYVMRLRRGRGRPDA